MTRFTFLRSIALASVLLLVGCQSARERLQPAEASASAYRSCMTENVGTNAAPVHSPAAKSRPAERVTKFAEALGLQAGPVPPVAPKATVKANGKGATATAGVTDEAIASAEAICQPKAQAFHAALLAAGLSARKADSMKADLISTMRLSLKR